MSDNLEKAAMMRNVRENQERDRRAWQEMEDRIGRLKEQNAAKDSLNNDLIVNCNQIRDRCWKAEGELARWQEIAKEERVKVIVLIEKLKDVANHSDWQTRGLSKTFAEYEEQAAKELQLEAAKEAGYVERLEAAYLDLKTADSWDAAYNPLDRDAGEQVARSRELAQAALAEIREGT